MVSGDSTVLASSRQSARSDSTPDPPEPRQSGMAPQMEQRLGLQRCQGFRIVSPGEAPESWDRCLRCMRF